MAVNHAAEFKGDSPRMRFVYIPDNCIISVISLEAGWELGTMNMIGWHSKVPDWSTA